MKSTEHNRISTIDLLRLIFAVIIVLHHGQESFGFPHLGIVHLAHNGAIGVEFFFIVAGFLMAKSADKPRLKALGSDTFDFMGRKLKSFFPYHLFAFSLAFAVQIIVNSLSAKGVIKLAISSLPNVLLVFMSGLNFSMVNGYEWFLSVMLLTMLILYPLLRKYFDTFIHVLAPALAIFLLGFSSKNYEVLSHVTFWNGYVYKGLLRAVSEIALGCFCYAIYLRIKKTAIPHKAIYVLSIAEILAYVIVLGYTCSGLPEQYYFHLIPILAFAITLSFSQVTFTAKLNQFNFKYLGELSLALYLNHYYPLLLVEKYLGTLSPPVKVGLHLGISVLCSVACVGVVKFVRRKRKGLKN